MEMNRTETRKNAKIDNACGLLPLPPFARSVAIALAASTCAVTACLQPVRAEGSRNLYPASATGSRANLEWRTSTNTANLWGGILQRRTLLKVYAEAGEYILLGSSAVDVVGTNGQRGDIRVYDPGLVSGSIGSENIPGTPSFSCLNQSQTTGNTAQGRITSRNQELAGPDTIITPATATPGGAVANGYVPCFYQAPTTGIYDVVIYGPNGFNSNTNPNSGNVLGSIADVTNNFDSNQLSTVSTWDVTVRNSLTSTTDINGRLFTYALSLFTGDNGRPVNPSVYVVTADGYRYQTDLKGIDPNGFMVYGNLEGFLDSDGVTPLYHDIRGTDALLSTIEGGVSLARPQFPIFFSDLKNPSVALEAEKILSALNIPTMPVVPVVTAPTFAGTAGGNNSYVGTGGTFNFNSSISGTYELIIQGSGSTDFDPANPLNRILRGIMSSSGPQSVTWDGKDNSGNFFPLGNNYQARVTVRAGEYHFPLLDVENSTQGGPSVTLINPPAAHPLGNSTAFFDDTNYTTKAGASITIQGCGSNPPPGAPGFPGRSDPINGFDSIANSSYRIFGSGSGGNTNSPCTGSFGDVKGLDLWTYFPSPSEIGTFNIINLPPDLTITKTATGDFTLGQNGTYTITVTNAATAGPTTDIITVSDTLPPELTFVSGTGTGWTCSASGQIVTCTNPGPLAAGASSTITLTVNPTTPGTVSNSASVATPGEIITDNNNSPAVTNTVAPPSADLGIAKTDNQTSTSPGSPITYTVTVTNNGPSTVNSVTVTEAVPASIVAPTFTPSQGSYDSATGAWTGLTLASGQSVTLTVSGTVAANATGTLTNTARVQPPAGVIDSNPANDTATDTTALTPSADLGIAKTDNQTSTSPGSPITYTVTVTNNGPSTVNSVTVTEAVPASIVAPTFTPSQGSYDSATGAWTGLTLASGQSVTLTVSGTVAANATGTLTNTARVQPPAGVTDSNPVNDAATDTTEIAPAASADLNIAKTANQTSVAPGSPISYTITVNNSGPSNVTGATVTDDLPAEITGATWSCAITSGNGSCGAATGTGDINTTVNLDSGATATYTVTGTVAPTATGNLSNTAQVQPPAGVTDPTPGNNNSPAVVTPITTSRADLAVIKTVNNPNPQPGSNITYTVSVTNNGPDTATGVQITDELPPGLTFVSAAPNQGTYDNTTGVWNIGSISVGNTVQLQITATVNASTPQTNTATVTKLDQADPNTSNNSDSVTVPQQPADLAVTKTADNLNPQPGTNVTYTVTLTNLGAGNATGVQIIDQLPAGLTFVAATPSVGTYNSATGLWTVGNLNNGASATLQITATVNSGNQITNTAAIAASDQTDPNPNNNNAQVTIPQQQADLSVNKTVDNPNPTVGQTINYTVTLTNNGPSAATGISLTDQLPPSLTFVGATASQGTYNIGTGVWNAGNLANGATATLTIRATVNAATPATNTAQITAADQTDPNPGNNSNSVTIPQEPADLSVQKTVDNPNPSVGQTINYTVTLSNLGAGNATDVAVTDKLPDGLIFLGATPSQGTYDSATGIWSVGNVANQASATLTIRSRVNAANPITNTAQVTASDQPDPNPNNNSGSLTIPQQGADLSVSKTADNLNPQPGTTITYSIRLTNAGPATATNVQVRDQLPAGITFLSATPEAGTYDSNTGVWTVPSLASGASTTLRIAATVNTGDRVTNTAQITASDQPDPDPTDNQASVTLPSGGADLSLGKTIDNPNARPGQNVTYTLTLSNSGPENATGVQVTDRLPAGLTFVSAAPSAGTYDSTTGIWTVPSLANGASATLRITATVNAARVTNTASITAADQPDPDSTPGNSNDSEDDQASVTIPQEESDLSVTKTVDNANPSVGQTVNYTINVRNSGPAGATNVQVSDPLPSGLSFVSAAPSVGTYDSATGIWTVGAIAPNGTATLTIQATLNATGVVVNTARVTADQGDSNPDNNQASVAVPQKPNLRLVKRLTRVNSTTFTELVNDPNDANDEAANWPSNYLQGRIDGGSIQPGDEVEYTIYFLSDGGAAAANVTVCDLVPANLAFLPDAFGSARGIAAFLNGSQFAYTNAGDGDSGQFYPAGTLAPQSCRGDNGNGAVVVNLGTIPSANGSTPANSYGFVRFRARLRE